MDPPGRYLGFTLLLPPVVRRTRAVFLYQATEGGRLPDLLASAFYWHPGSGRRPGFVNSAWQIGAESPPRRADHLAGAVACGEHRFRARFRARAPLAMPGPRPRPGGRGPSLGAAGGWHGLSRPNRAQIVSCFVSSSFACLRLGSDESAERRDLAAIFRPTRTSNLYAQLISYSRLPVPGQGLPDQRPASFAGTV